MKDENFSRYRVLYKKPGEVEVVVTIDTCSIEQVYESVCSCAGVSSTVDLESLEIHEVKDNGEVHVHKNHPIKVEKSKALVAVQEKFPGVTRTRSYRFDVIPVPLQ